MSMRVIKKSKKSQARLGVLETAHGKINTPFFMPVATRGAVKGLSAAEVGALGAQIILSNTYHLFLRPGTEIMKKAGGLHKFMNWNGPMLTDSGGYQVFSLSKIRKIREDGVEFVSEIDGRKIFLTPEKAIEIQQALGSDIMMVLDICSPYPSAQDEIEKAIKITTDWAKRCQAQKKKSRKKQMLFGIVQGGVYPDLRKKSLDELLKFDFDGIAIGGLTIGEPIAKTYEIVGSLSPFLPPEKPHYLMGVGVPEQIVKFVKMGIDMFDCVIPTRHARHGDLFVWKKNADVAGNKKFCDTLHITNSKYKDDMKPIEKGCPCPACQNFSRAYIHHLFKIRESLGQSLATAHNLHFFAQLMERIRKGIKDGKI